MSCPLCGAQALRPCAELRDVPVLVNALYSDAEAARSCGRGDITLEFCQSCGHVFNSSFDPNKIEYLGDYETSLHASARFCDWAAALATRLIQEHELENRCVLEIGCGRGEFLALFAKRCIAVGFDQSFDPKRVQIESGVSIHSRYFDPDQDQERGSLVISRHVLEHLADPVGFLKLLGRACSDDGALYVEVPNGAWLMQEGSIWDLIYEHVSIFTPASLSFAFAQAGLCQTSLAPSYGEQFLAIEGRHGQAPLPPLSPAPWLAAQERFSAALEQRIAQFSRLLAKAQRQDQRIALWGAGSKGVSFLNFVPEAESVACVIDKNPRKHGAHVAGTGQRILSPEEASKEPLDLVLVMNPLYQAEIQSELAQLGQSPELLSSL
ncbi:MAG: hypothetical protein CSA62_00560 [Planctomycetota bacterium]|nr:MAG: hypothetical protein CSA62_00560 [Planctomycetota bacterium]